MDLPKTHQNNWSENALVALAFAIPCAKKLIPLVIGIVFIVAITRTIRLKKLQTPQRISLPLGLLILYALLIGGLCYTDEPERGLMELEIKLSFLIFPLLSWLLPNIGLESFRKISYSFVLGCLAFLIVTVTRAAFISFQAHDLYFMSYENLSWYIHPTYAALYQSFGIYLLADAALEKKYLLNKPRLHAIAMACMLIFIGLLASKAGLIGAIIAIALCSWKAFQKRIAFGKIMTGAFAATTIVIATTAFLPQSAHRVQMAMQDLHVTENPTATGATTGASEVHTVSLSSTQLRLVTWQASWHVLLAHPFGAGTGGVQKILDNLYLMEGETFAEEHHLNSHNQFLQTGAEHGWPGLAVLILLLFALVRFVSISTGLHVAQVFALLCGMNFLFESFLEVQAGIVFFSFWLLIFAKIKRGF